MKNCIYMALDKNYECYGIPALKSIFVNWTTHPVIKLFVSSCSAELKETIKGQNVELIESKINFDFTNLGPVSNSIVYNKYICWNPEYFGDYDNVLHLDADILVLKNLDSIFDGEMNIWDNNEILNVKPLSFSDECNKMLSKDKLHIIKMVNAGVFCVPKKYITKKQYNSLVSITKKYQDHLTYADQSAITLWCYKNKIEIRNDVIFNYQPQFLNYKDASSLSEVSLLHFAARKPDTIEFMSWWRLDSKQEELYNLWKGYN